MYLQDTHILDLPLQCQLHKRRTSDAPLPNVPGPLPHMAIALSIHHKYRIFPVPRQTITASINGLCNTPPYRSPRPRIRRPSTRVPPPSSPTHTPALIPLPHPPHSPFAGKLLADYGASVLRIDRATATSTPAPDLLAAHKRSIRVNLKSPAGTSLLLALIPKTDILIDPFRPGVLESLGLGPSVLLALNPRLIYARLVGFQREGKYAAMAGHDINYLAVSGLLSMLGRAGAPPHPPGNVVGDFAGGGLMCVLGVLLALVVRAGTGRGQVVEANMVDGSAYLGSFPRFAQLARGGMWAAERGRNLLDGGAPFYDTYETRDGGFMALLVPPIPTR